MAAGVGTLAMDLASYAKFRRTGGRQKFFGWESGATIQGWDDASTPGLLGKRLIEGALQRQLPDSRARLTNNIVHWTTGLAWGAAYALLAGGAQHPKRWWGAVLGPAAWLTSYTLLPATGLYKPMPEYDAATLASDLATHIVYGLTTSTTFASMH
jgi:Protein of unknown function (DUF1440)